MGADDERVLGTGRVGSLRLFERARDGRRVTRAKRKSPEVSVAEVKRHVEHVASVAEVGARVGEIARLGNHHSVGICVEHLAELTNEVFRLVEKATVGRRFDEQRNHVTPEAIDTAIEPELRHIQSSGSDFGVSVIEIGLLRIEAMKVVLTAHRIELPRALAEARVLGAAAHVGIRRRIRPDVPVGLRIRLVRAGLEEPGVLIGGVIEHQIDDHAHFSIVCGGDQGVEIRKRAVIGVHVLVVGHVVARILERSRHDRHEPDRVDAELLQIVETRGETWEVADPVAVRILKRAHVHFVKDRMSVPVRPLEEGIGFHGPVLFWERRLGRLTSAVVTTARHREAGDSDGEPTASRHADHSHASWPGGNAWA